MNENSIRLLIELKSKMTETYTEYMLIINELISRYNSDITTTTTTTTTATTDHDDVAVRFEKATGVDGVNAQTAERDIYYDLQGRRVENPTRGVYIHNGKKVFFK